jgi:hypothetical protein
MAVSQRDIAAAVGTVAGEALNEPFEGQAAVVDVLANRVTYARDGYGVITEPGLAGVARAGRYGPAGRAGMREFDAWSERTNARAYATARMFEQAILDPAARAALSPGNKAKLEQIERATHGVLVDGSLRGITKGATFYNNPGITRTAMNSHMDALRPTGSFRIGGHVFGGKNYDPNAKFDTAAAKANAHAGWASTGVYDTAGEKSRDQRAMEASRTDMLRDDAAVTAPFWDGSSMATTTAPGLSPIGFNRSADPYDFGQSTPANAVMGPVDFSGGLESGNIGYTAPAPASASFGSPLADRAAPTETYTTGGSFGMDAAPTAPAADFSMGMDAANIGAPSAAGSSFGSGLADRVAPGGTPGFTAVDALGSPAQSDYAVPSYDRSISATPWGYAGTPNFQEALSVLGPQGIQAELQPGTGPVVGSMLGYTMDRNAVYTPSSRPTQAAAWAESVPELAPDLTPSVSRSTGWGRAEDKPRTPAAQPNTALAREVPLDIPAPYPLDIPAYAPLDDLPAPINVGVKPAAAPARAAPRSIAAPAPVRDFRPVEASQPARTERVGLERYDSPGGFLGGFLSGDRAAIGDLSRATGTDYTGIAQRAMGDDQYAQPAMLGLGNAYAEATGQQGYKGLFDGIFGGGPSTTQASGWGTGGLYDPNASSASSSSGWGLGNIFTGENVGRGVGGVAGSVLAGPLGGIAGGYLGGVIGNAVSPSYDPYSLDPAKNGGTGGLYDPRDNNTGFFGGLFDGWGSGGSNSDGLGTTPGAGGLY